MSVLVTVPSTDEDEPFCKADTGSAHVVRAFEEQKRERKATGGVRTNFLRSKVFRVDATFTCEDETVYGATTAVKFCLQMTCRNLLDLVYHLPPISIRRASSARVVYRGRSILFSWKVE